MPEWLTDGERLKTLLTAIGLLPAVGGVLLLILPAWGCRNAARGVALGMTAVTLMTSAAVFAVVLSTDLTVVSTAAYQWLSIPSAPSHFAIGFGLQADSTSLLLMLAACVATVIVIATESSPVNSMRPYVTAMTALWAVAMVLFSTNLFCLFLFWQVAGFCGAAAIVRRDERHQNVGIARKVLLFGWGADVFLLVGCLLMWKTFGTADLTAVLTTVANPESISDAAKTALGTIGLCLVIGIVGRCWQFPFLGLVGDAERVRGSAMLQVFVVMPTGVFLAVRCLPLLRAAEFAGDGLAFVGGLTCLLAGAGAMTADGPTATVNRAIVSWFGLILVGLGSGMVGGQIGALSLFVTVSTAAVALAAVYVDRRPAEALPRGVVWVAVAVLATGLAGQNRISAAVAGGIVNGASIGWANVVLLGLIGGGQFFTAAALGRAFAVRPTNAGMTPLTRWFAIAGILIATAVAIFANSSRAGLVMVASMTETHRVDWIMTAFVALIGVAGCALGWMQTTHLAKAEQASGGRWNHITGIARHAFYLDDLWDLLAIQPLRAGGQLARFCEWFFVDRLLIAVPSRLLRSTQQVAETLRDRTFSFYAVSVVLATALLLSLLAWPGG